MAAFSYPAAVQGRLRELGRLIRAAREERGMNQRDLAGRAGTSRPTIQRLEGGSPSVAWGRVAVVCWLLDLPTDPEALDPARKAELETKDAFVQRVRRPAVDDDF